MRGRGYPRTTARLNRKLAALGRPRVNERRVYRIVAINGLLLQKHTERPARTHEGEIVTLKSNTRWCSDVCAIICWNGEIVWVAFSLDCCDREAMSYIATTAGVSGETNRHLIAGTIESRFGLVDRVPHKIEWFSDNGSVYTAHDTRNFAQSVGLAVCTTPVQSPESNGMAEGFVNEDVQARFMFMCTVSITPGSFWSRCRGGSGTTNEIAPHKGLKLMSPREYRKSLAASAECPVQWR